MPNNAETPGFSLTDEDKIERDFRGFYKLSLKRTTSVRMRQISTILTQSWRANTDIQILLYDTPPMNPSPTELSTIVDYCVSYVTKTCKATDMEKIMLTKLIQE